MKVLCHFSKTYKCKSSGDSGLLALSSVVLSTWWIILLTTNMIKPFQDANFSMKFISEDNLFGKHIHDACEAKLLIHTALWVHST